MSVECAAEKQEHRDEDGDPKNADREAKAEAEAHRITLRSTGGPSYPSPPQPLSAHQRVGLVFVLLEGGA